MRAWITPEEGASLMARGSGRGIKVAVIDSGVELAHPRLAGVPLTDDVAIVSDGLQLVNQPGDGKDLFGHGTAVADIVHSVAPDASIGSFRVLDGTCNSRSEIICEAVRQAMDLGYQIINCSFGCGILDHVLQYKTWVDEAYLRGVHVVAACNNTDYATPEWPGYFASVVTVNMASTEELDRFWYKRGNLVEFAARGVSIDVAWRNGKIKHVTGSSFAAPRVAGMLARLLSEAPDLTPVEVKALFHQIASPWTDEIIGPNVSYSA
jgi:subtilisin family serine protease